jgi:serine/threonine-protein kinase
MNLDSLRASLADRYAIEREIGAGGMATVYLAEDLKHDRNVAIKVLHPDLGAALGGERFLTEIRTTARLQHPHILPLLDSGEANGLLYYVMPLVTGETLRARLDRERLLPVDEALQIAREVADALGYAHGQDVIHRDIKPENILLQDGHALVADFGIALAVQSAGGTRMTQTGLSLGTPQYMSPEQAMGERAIDARSDVYSLGAVTYEMLAGDPPFTGSSVQAIVAKVMTERPTPIHTVRDTVPEPVEVAVMKALAKLPADRFVTAPAFAAALIAGTGVAAPRTAPSRGRPGVPGWWVAAGVVVAVLGFLAGQQLSSGTGEPFTTFGRAVPVTWEQGLELTPALSPDGKQVAYSVGNGTRSKIYVRAIADGSPTPLTSDTLAVELFPRWSRDGTRILYIKDGLVFSVPAGGGPPRQEIPARSQPVLSATWSPDNSQIAYSAGDTLFVHQADGTSRRLATVRDLTLCTWGPRDLIACSEGNGLYLMPGIGFGNIAPSWITVIRVSDGSVVTVTDSSSNNQSPQWSRDGRHLLYLSNQFGPADLYALSLADDGSPRGSPNRLTVGLNISTFSLSADDSRLAYAVMTTSANVWSEPWTGRSVPSGSRRPTQVTFGRQSIEAFTLSRDGRWIFYDSDLAGNSDIYRMSIATGIPERLTTDGTPEFAPGPSPDGRTVVFHSFRGDSRDIYLQPLDGGALEKITDTPEQEAQPSWSPDGTSIAYFLLTGSAAIRIASRGPDGVWDVRERLADGYWPRWSPDGRSLVFTSNLLGGDLRIMPVDSGEPRVLYDLQQPGAPVAETAIWSDDGRTIYFKSHDVSGAASVWSVPAAGGIPERLIDLGDDRLSSDRYGFRFGNGLIYYTLTDRQSNIWLMELTP